MKTRRRDIFLLIAEVLLPALPGMWALLFRPGTVLLTPQAVIPVVLCVNLLILLLWWRRPGQTLSKRLDAILVLALFTLAPWVSYEMLPVAALENRLWLQTGWYCLGQAACYAVVVVAPGWFGRFRQRRYEERVLAGEEKFESRKEVMAAREREAGNSEKP